MIPPPVFTIHSSHFGKEQVAGWDILHGPQKSFGRSRLGPESIIGGALGTPRISDALVAVLAEKNKFVLASLDHR